MGRSKRGWSKNGTTEYKEKAEIKKSEKAIKNAAKARNRKEQKKLKPNTTMEEIHYVGVYCNFRKGKHMNGQLRTADITYVGKYETDPIYNVYSLRNDTDIGIKENGCTSVTMEVYRVPDSFLDKTLDDHFSYYGDHVDEHYSTYLRKEVNSPYGKIWIYVFTDIHNASTSKKLNTGDWVEYTFELARNKPSLFDERPRESQI